METRRRFAHGDGVGGTGNFGELGEKEGLMGNVGAEEILDDQGKWEKGHGAGPGIGGRRGLPPRQRTGGWVSSHDVYVAMLSSS